MDSVIHLSNNRGLSNYTKIIILLRLSEYLRDYSTILTSPLANNCQINADTDDLFMESVRTIIIDSEAKKKFKLVSFTLNKKN